MRSREIVAWALAIGAIVPAVAVSCGYPDFTFQSADTSSPDGVSIQAHASIASHGSAGSGGMGGSGGIGGIGGSGGSGAKSGSGNSGGGMSGSGGKSGSGGLSGSGGSGGVNGSGGSGGMGGAGASSTVIASTSSSASSTATSSSASSTGASSSAASSSSGSGIPYTVPCQDGSLMCNGPELCCFSQSTDLGCDACSIGGQCAMSCLGMGFYQLHCNDVTDCQPGNICCGSFGSGAIIDTHCAASCTVDEYVFCASDAECPASFCDPVVGYSGYSTCF